ncbi:MAG: hypothetical protein M3Y13_00170 [Armatimonadota bacterium]|nr:hypothetical protein [Armatimonadota bacterium]
MISRLALVLSLLLIAAVGVSAKPPALEPASEFPTSVLAGHQYVFHLTYKQSEGDPPATQQMIVDAPGGPIKQGAFKPVGDPTAGEDISWDFTPEQSGQYQYHFEVTSSTGGIARYPAGSGELQFESPNPIIKYIVLAVGLVIALFFLPFIVYMLARSANKQGDPAAAARIALLIGILAFCGLAWYLFLYDNQDFPSKMLGIVIEALAIGAFLVVMITRRKAV